MQLISYKISDIQSMINIDQSQCLNILFDKPIYKDINIFLNPKQDAQINIQTLFKSNNCKSNINIKILLTNKVQLNNQTIIDIPFNIENIDVFLNIESLVINKYCKLSISPILKIRSDKVNVSHNIKNIYLDKEQYNYIYSRGLNKKNIKKVLIDNFYAQ